MKKIVSSLLVALVLLAPMSTALANDVYVPFPKVEQKDDSEKINFEDLNLKESLLEYYKFHIDKNYSDKDITVGMMKKFTSLSLPWSNIFSLKGLEYATNLKNLNLSNNFIEDVSPLSNLMNLEDLNLSNNKIKDTNALATLTKLKQVSLRKNLMTNIDFLDNLHVENLDISMNSVLKDYIPNNLNLKNVRVLNISGVGVDNINFLKEATKLETLIAEENSIKDISAIKDLKNVRVVYFSKNNITDISPLSDLENITELLLSKNNIEDISVLQGKKYLYRLMLDGNERLRDISVLSTVENLASLDISKTQVSDITALNDLKYLYYFAEKNTNISKESLKNLKTNNERVKQENNIDKKLEIVENEAGKYFSIKNYIFMLLILALTATGIRSYWKKNA